MEHLVDFLSVGLEWWLLLLGVIVAITTFISALSVVSKNFRPRAAYDPGVLFDVQAKKRTEMPREAEYPSRETNSFLPLSKEDEKELESSYSKLQPIEKNIEKYQAKSSYLAAEISKALNELSEVVSEL